MTYKEIPRPPVFNGAEEFENWQLLRRYLWQLSERLEQIINTTAEGEQDNGE